MPHGVGCRNIRAARSLTTESFELDRDPPSVVSESASSKRRRRDVQPIRREFAEALRSWLNKFTVGDAVSAKLPRDTAKMLRKDLAAARDNWIRQAGDREAELRRRAADFLIYRDRKGKIADFHATRHTSISMLVAGGASPKTCQDLARHSTSRLTLDRYAHTKSRDKEDALTGRLGHISMPRPSHEDGTVSTTGSGGRLEQRAGARRHNSMRYRAASPRLRLPSQTVKKLAECRF